MSAALSLPPLGSAILAMYLAVGFSLGLLYFGSLWWNARLFSGSGRLRTVLAMAAARFALLGGVLALASLEGAGPLLATALGVLGARAVVLRRVRRSLA